MQLFLGAYRTDPQEWFLSWATDAKDAAWQASENGGHPDPETIAPVSGAALVTFEAFVEDGVGQGRTPRRGLRVRLEDARDQERVLQTLEARLVQQPPEPPVPAATVPAVHAPSLGTLRTEANEFLRWAAKEEDSKRAVLLLRKAKVRLDEAARQRSKDAALKAKRQEVAQRLRKTGWPAGASAAWCLRKGRDVLEHGRGFTGTAAWEHPLVAALYFEDALKMDPKNLEARVELARALLLGSQAIEDDVLRLQRLAAALETLDSAAALKNPSRSAMALRDEVRARLGKEIRELPVPSKGRRKIPR